jgi:hypothetical protein
MVKGKKHNIKLIIKEIVKQYEAVLKPANKTKMRIRMATES